MCGGHLGSVPGLARPGDWEEGSATRLCPRQGQGERGERRASPVVAAPTAVPPRRVPLQQERRRAGGKGEAITRCLTMN